MDIFVYICISLSQTNKNILKQPDLYRLRPVFIGRFYFMQYYIYAHKRKDNNQIFYIGKGTIDRRRNTMRSIYYRANDERNRSLLWNRISKKYGYYVDILFHFDSESEAFEKEIELISLYGKIIDKTGILANLTDGGEGKSGHKDSYETRLKKSIFMKNRVVSDETKLNISKSRKGFKHTSETKELLRLKSLGYRHSEDTKKKISEMYKGEGNPMYGVKGGKHPMYGYKVSDEVKRMYMVKYSHKIFCKTENEEITFDCTRDCADYFNVTTSMIRKLVRNHNNGVYNKRGKFKGVILTQM